MITKSCCSAIIMKKHNNTTHQRKGQITVGRQNAAAHACKVNVKQHQISYKWKRSWRRKTETNARVISKTIKWIKTALLTCVRIPLSIIKHLLMIAKLSRTTFSRAHFVGSASGRYELWFHYTTKYREHIGVDRGKRKSNCCMLKK